MSLHWFALIALLLNAQTPSRHTQSAWMRDTDLQAAVFQRLCKDYCVGEFKPKLIFLGLGRENVQDPSPGVISRLSKNSTTLFRNFSNGVKEQYSEAIRDKQTNIAGAVFYIRDVTLIKGRIWEARVERYLANHFPGGVSYILHDNDKGWEVANARTGDLSRVALQGVINRHAYKIIPEKRPFAPSKHKIRLAPREGASDNACLINGRKPLGTGGLIPLDELFRFDVFIDGVKWRVPESLWKDCYHLNLEQMLRNRLQASQTPPRNAKEMYEADDADKILGLSPDGKRLWLIGSGSDASCGYTILWKLGADGRGSRKVAGER